MIYFSNKTRAEELKEKYRDYAEILSLAEDNDKDLELCIAKAKQNTLQDISLTLALICDEMIRVKSEKENADD